MPKLRKIMKLFGNSLFRSFLTEIPSKKLLRKIEVQGNEVKIISSVRAGSGILER